MAEMSDEEFEALEDRVDELAGQPSAPAPNRPHHFDPVRNEADFEALVQEALDGLPPDVIRQLDRVAVVVSDQGAHQHLYGQWAGIDPKYRTDFWSGAAPDEITIFRDTLIRDFGHDPERLRAEVTRVVRHEVGHHLGFDEDGVHELGL